VPAEKFTIIAFVSMENNKPCPAFLLNAAGVCLNTSFADPILNTPGAKTSVSKSINMHEKITPNVVTTKPLYILLGSSFFFPPYIRPKEKMHTRNIALPRYKSQVSVYRSSRKNKTTGIQYRTEEIMPNLLK